jgi:hypothetical protein
MKDLLIFYLTANDRHFVFEKFVKELEKLKHINRVKLLISTSDSNSEYYSEYMNSINLDYTIHTVQCPSYNYLPKVKDAISYATNNNIKYIMKCDNDVIIPTYTIDFIIENIEYLDNPENLTISPTLTTGIPSVEYFLDEFLTKDEVNLVRNEFKKCIFNVQPNIMDYTFLNEHINLNLDWDYDNFFKKLKSNIDNLPDYGNGRTVNSYNKHYKGIHPIRHGFGNSLINEFVIQYKERFFSNKNCTLFRDGKPYLCNMCFFIKTEVYDDIINKKNLIIDGCDEVPLNRYRNDNNMAHLIVRGGFAIHITYNWRWFLNNVDGGSNIDKPKITLEQFEKEFIDRLYNDSN